MPVGNADGAFSEIRHSHLIGGKDLVSHTGRNNCILCGSAWGLDFVIKNM